MKMKEQTPRTERLDKIVREVTDDILRKAGMKLTEQKDYQPPKNTKYYYN